jgi:exodeoxyribonuclease VII large subunit
MAGFDSHHTVLDGHRARLGSAIDNALRREQTALTHALERVRSLSPKATLDRGYAILVDGEGASITSVTQTEPGDQLFVHLHDGRLLVEVDDLAPKQQGAP